MCRIANNNGFANRINGGLPDNANPGVAAGGPAQGRSINSFLGRASIDFGKLRDAADGHYNMGEIVVRNNGGRLKLDIVNNHVGWWHADENNQVTTSEDRCRTNMAVFKALLKNFTGENEARAVSALLSKAPRDVGDGDFDGFANKHIKTAFDFLLGADNLGEKARPLSRDETAYLIKLLSRGTEGEVSSRDVKSLYDLRAFKAGGISTPWSVRDLVKGFSVTNAGSAERVRVMEVSVNQRLAEVERANLTGDHPTDEEALDRARMTWRAGLARGRTVLAKDMQDIGNLVLRRVVDVVQEFGANLHAANAWDVAKTLSKGVMAEIMAAVRKYNARVPEADRISTDHVAGAVVERMAQAVKTLLNDNGHKWPDHALQSFTALLKDGFNRKLNGEHGFPVRAREDFSLLDGKPIDQMVAEYWDRPQTYHPVFGFARTVAVEGDLQQALGRLITENIEKNGFDRLIHADWPNDEAAKKGIVKFLEKQICRGVSDVIDPPVRETFERPFPFRFSHDVNDKNAQMNSNLSRDEAGVYHLDVEFSGKIGSLMDGKGPVRDFGETGRNATKMSYSLSLDLTVDAEGKAVVTVAKGGRMRVEIPPKKVENPVATVLGREETYFRAHQEQIRDAAEQIREGLVKQGVMSNAEAAKFDELVKAFALDVAEVYGMDVGEFDQQWHCWEVSLGLLARRAMGGRPMTQVEGLANDAFVREVNSRSADVFVNHIKGLPKRLVVRLLALSDNPATGNGFLAVATDEQIQGLLKTRGEDCLNMFYDINARGVYRAEGALPQPPKTARAYHVEVMSDPFVRDERPEVSQARMSRTTLLKGETGLLLESTELAESVAWPGPTDVTITLDNVKFDVVGYDVESAMRLGRQNSRHQLDVDLPRLNPIISIGGETIDFNIFREGELAEEAERKYRPRFNLLYGKLEEICGTNTEQLVVAGYLLSQTGRFFQAALRVPAEVSKGMECKVEKFDDGRVRLSFVHEAVANAPGYSLKFAYDIMPDGTNKMTSLDYHVPARAV